jgi:hypothetical protein
MLSLPVKIEGQIIKKTIPISASNPFSPTQYIHGGGLFNEFIKTVNDNHLKVLEIGSRIVSPGSCSKRSMFPGANSYTGFDIYPDSNTDIVGDAHKYLNILEMKNLMPFFLCLYLNTWQCHGWLLGRLTEYWRRGNNIPFYSFLLANP